MLENKARIKFKLFLLLKYYFIIQSVFLSSFSFASDEVLKKAEAYFNLKEMRGDAAFFVYQGAKLRNIPIVLKPLTSMLMRRDQFPFNLEFKLWAEKYSDFSIPRQNVFLSLDRTVDVSNSTYLRNKSQVSQKEWSEMMGVVMGVMALTFECSSDRLRKMTPSHEYIAAHQLFSYIYARVKGCLNNAEFKKLHYPYARRVYTELLQSGFVLSDLQVERIALLCMSGHCDSVPDKYFSLMISRQLDNGLWQLKDNIVPKKIPYEHASAMAYYALSRKKSGK